MICLYYIYIYMSATRPPIDIDIDIIYIYIYILYMFIRSYKHIIMPKRLLWQLKEPRLTKKNICPSERTKGPGGWWLSFGAHA